MESPKRQSLRLSSDTSLDSLPALAAHTVAGTEAAQDPLADKHSPEIDFDLCKNASSDAGRGTRVVQHSCSSRLLLDGFKRRAKY